MAATETSDLVRSDGEAKVQRRKPPTAALNPEEAAKKQRQLEANQQYGRGKAIQTKNIKDRKLRANLRALEDRYKDATLKAKDAEIRSRVAVARREPVGRRRRMRRRGVVFNWGGGSQAPNGSRESHKRCTERGRRLGKEK